MCWCCIFSILVFSDLLCDFFGLHCCGECAGMPRDWSMQTGKWAVFLEGCESSSGPVCPGTRNFWKELERKLLKRYVETTYTKVIFQSHIDQLRWCLSSGCTHHIRLTEISGNLGLLDLFSISLLASQDGKPTFTLRIQQRITTSSPICVLMNTTGLTPNKGQQLSKWQDHIIDSLIRCPCSSKVFNSVGMPSKSLRMEVNWYENFNR